MEQRAKQVHGERGAGRLRRAPGPGRLAGGRPARPGRRCSRVAGAARAAGLAGLQVGAGRCTPSAGGCSQGGSGVQQRGSLAITYCQVAGLDAVALGDLRQQAGRGRRQPQASSATWGRKQRIHAPPLGAELAQQLGVDGVERAGIEQAAAQAGLGWLRPPPCATRAVELEPRPAARRAGLPLVGVAEVVIAQGLSVPSRSKMAIFIMRTTRGGRHRLPGGDVAATPAPLRQL